MLIENHKARLRESLRALAWAADQGAQESQRTIGFHAVAAACDLLNIYLHQENLTDSSSDITHKRLRSDQKLERALPLEFPRRDEVASLLVSLESQRDGLCYGKLRSEQEAEESLALFGGSSAESMGRANPGEAAKEGKVMEHPAPYPEE